MTDIMIKVIGDENDGDYIDLVLGPDQQNAIIFKDSKYFKTSTVMELINILVSVLKSDTRKGHNWSRLEYDDRTAKMQTLEMIINKMVENGDLLVDMDADNADEFYDDVYKELEEWIEDNIIPYGEYGVHTIVKIVSYPKESVTTIYSK